MLQIILDWSEVWATLIPLTFILSRKNIPVYLKPVRLYVWVALLLNTAATLLWWFKNPWGIEKGDFFWSNTFLYNTHSIIRLLLFSWFFILLKQRFMHRVKIILPLLFIAFIIINFTFYEKFFTDSLSSLLLATEAAILLFLCLQYFIYLMLEDRNITLRKQPGFWIVAGLSIYVSVNFFIFLFYAYLTKQNWQFAYHIWDVHNIVFIILCISLARGFYELSE